MTKRGGLAATLEHKILSGEWKPGDLLPSEHDLMGETGYSRTTVRAALAQLEQSGLVEGGPGTRRRVAERVLLEVHVTRPASRVMGGQFPTRGADSWEHDVTQLGHNAAEILTVRSHQAGELARALGMSQADPVVTRELTRLVDGRPHNQVTWTFPRWLAGGTKLVSPDNIPEGSIPYLSGLGHGPDDYTLQVEARMPSTAERGVLVIGEGVPLLVETRTGFDHSGAVFVSVTRWPADRARLIVEM
jgi:GntR family transcriptional regulator